jgi:hypothetical protein
VDRAPVTELLPAVSAALGDEPGWIVSGSVAMHLHGLNVSTRDLDIWCTDEALERFATRLNRPVAARRTKYFESRVLDLSMLGWEVEISGTVELNSGVRLKVDEAILERAKGSPPVESPEDLLAELLALNREPPKNDFARACALYELVGRKIDSAYLRPRLRAWEVSDELIERLVGHGTEG